MFIEVYLLMQVALIPVILREFQLSLLEASLVATIPSLVALLMNVPLGFLADRISANHLLFVSMLIEGLSTFLVSQTTNFWTLVLGVSLLKISSPIYHISGLSQLSLFAKPEQISRWIGYHNALGNAGAAAGLVTLAVFLSTMGWRLTYLFWAIPIVGWGFVNLRYQQFKIKRKFGKGLHEDGGKLARTSLIFSSSFLILLMVAGIREMGASGGSTFMTTFFTEAKGLSEANASLIFSFGPFIGIVGSIGGGYLGEKLGTKKALSWINLGCALSLLTLPLVPEIYLLTLIYVAYSFFNSAVWSPMNTMVAKVTPETERGMSYSVYFLTEGMLASVAPTLAAGVIELTDIWFVFPFSAVFLIASVMILNFLSLPKQ